MGIDEVTRYRGHKKRRNRGWTAGEELGNKERRYEKLLDGEGKVTTTVVGGGVL
jgi:hypothetical protein